MQYTTFKNRIPGLLLFAVMSLLMLTAAAPGGVDYYKIYLNKKLIVERAVTDPLTLKSLALDKANADDNLTIHYRHCHMTANERRIQLKNEKGDVLKEWKFPDISTTDKPMTISVKELLVLQKKNTHLTLYYISQQAPKGQLLVGLQLGAKGSV